MRYLIDRLRERLTGAARWVILTVAGGLLLAAGIVMLFAPGPGWGAIALGLYLWAKQFAWARRALDRLMGWLDSHRHRLPAVVGRLIDGWRRRRATADATAATRPATSAEHATKPAEPAETVVHIELVDQADQVEPVEIVELPEPAEVSRGAASGGAS